MDFVHLRMIYMQGSAEKLTLPAGLRVQGLGFWV